MKPHIEQTIIDLDADIAQLEDLKRFLMARYGGGQDHTAPAVKPEPEPPLIAETAKHVPHKNKTAKRAPTCTTSELLDAAVAKLPEPFCASHIQKATGCDYGKAGGTIIRLKARGWIKRAGTTKGAGFKRTARFAMKNVFPAEENRNIAKAEMPTKQEPSYFKPVSPDGPTETLESQIYYAAKRAPEEFTAASLAVETQRTRDTLTLTLLKLERGGWVKRVGEEDGELVYKVAK